MKYRKGESGNPAGKPRGAKDRRTALRGLLEPHADKLIAKAVDLALAGDTTALRICIDRIIPPIKAKDSPVAIGSLEGSLESKASTVLNALSAGRITPDEAATLMGTIAVQAKILEVSELEKRVSELEKKK